MVSDANERGRKIGVPMILLQTTKKHSMQTSSLTCDCWTTSEINVLLQPQMFAISINHHHPSDI